MRVLIYILGEEYTVKSTFDDQLYCVRPGASSELIGKNRFETSYSWFVRDQTSRANSEMFDAVYELYDDLWDNIELKRFQLSKEDCTILRLKYPVGIL